MCAIIHLEGKQNIPLLDTVGDLLTPQSLPCFALAFCILGPCQGCKYILQFFIMITALAGKGIRENGLPNSLLIALVSDKDYAKHRQ